MPVQKILTKYGPCFHSKDKAGLDLKQTRGIIQLSNYLMVSLAAYRMVSGSILIICFTAKLFNVNFHSLEDVFRWRDPQLQVSENYSDLTKWRLTI